MFRNLITKWEKLAPRKQILVATPIAFVVLFLFHWSPIFPLLDWKESLTYAAMECIPVALIVTFATQSELARREHQNEQEDQKAGEDIAP